MNKDCKHTLENLSAFLDNELSDASASDIEDHLAICEDCQQELEQLSTLSALFKKVDLPVQDFSEQVITRLCQETDLDCTVIEEDVSAYVDDELDLAKTLSIQEHLEGCPACQKLISGFKKLSHLINSYVVSAGKDYSPDVLARLQPQKASCEKDFDLISAYIDNELSPKDKKEFAQHLLSCSSCRAKYDKMLEMRAYIKTALVENLEKPSFWPSVQYDLSKSKTNVTFIWSAVASILVVALTLFSMSLIFPVNTTNYAARINYADYNRNFDTNYSYTVSDLPIESDAYLFNTALETPANDVLPVMLGDSASNAYEY